MRIGSLKNNNNDRDNVLFEMISVTIQNFKVTSAKKLEALKM